MIEERLNLKDIDGNILFHGAIVFALVTRAGERILKGYGLSTGEFAVLMHLNATKEEINLSQVKHNTFLFSGASITKVAEKLLNKGFITRRENPKSRREKLVKVTPSGEKFTTKVLQAYRENYPKVLKGLSQSSKERLLKDLKTLFGNITDFRDKN